MQWRTCSLLHYIPEGNCSSGSCMSYYSFWNRSIHFHRTCTRACFCQQVLDSSRGSTGTGTDCKWMDSHIHSWLMKEGRGRKRFLPVFKHAIEIASASRVSLEHRHFLRNFWGQSAASFLNRYINHCVVSYQFCWLHPDEYFHSRFHFHRVVINIEELVWMIDMAILRKVNI